MQLSDAALECTPTKIRPLSASLKQDTFDKFWKNRSNLDLHVPLLSGYPGMHRNVLHRELNFDRQTPKLHHFAKAKPNWDRPNVLRRGVPIYQDITRVAQVPALAEED